MLPSSSQQLLFRKEQRLRTSPEFKRCYDGARAGDDHLLIFAVKNHLRHTRIGVSVSKKHGNAPARNRKKRLLRESFRLQQHELMPGLDMVLVPRQRTDSQLTDFTNSIRRLTLKLARKLSAEVRQEHA